MQGYWNKPVETEEVLREGWYHSGGMGCFDEEHFIFLVQGHEVVELTRILVRSMLTECRVGASQSRSR